MDVYENGGLSGTYSSSSGCGAYGCINVYDHKQCGTICDNDLNCFAWTYNAVSNVCYALQDGYTFTNEIGWIRGLGCDKK